MTADDLETDVCCFLLYYWACKIVGMIFNHVLIIEIIAVYWLFFESCSTAILSKRVYEDKDRKSGASIM